MLPTHVRIHETASLSAPPAAVFDLVASVEGMKLFQGHGPIPGIREVHFQDGGDPTTPGAVAQIVNSDGSRHRERILAHERPRLHAITLWDFQPPFGALISSAEEILRFVPAGEGTRLERTFTFALRSPLAWPVAALLVRGPFRRALRRNHAALARILPR